MPSSPFLCSIKEYMLVLRHSPGTIKAYLYWIKCFHNKQYTLTLSEIDIESFLTYLAVNRRVST